VIFKLTTGIVAVALFALAFRFDSLEAGLGCAVLGSLCVLGMLWRQIEESVARRNGGRR
jgi:hypothetical protein